MGISDMRLGTRWRVDPVVRVVVFVIGSAYSDLAISAQDIEASPLLVQGKMVDPQDSSYRFQVAIVEKPSSINDKSEEDFVCAGTLLSKKWVLSAAHCIYDRKLKPHDPSALQVYVGSYNFRHGERIGVKSIKKYPTYEYLSDNNDVALFELAREPHRDTPTKNVELVAEREDQQPPDEPPDDAEVVVLGWGATSPVTNAPSRNQELRQATLNLVERKDCNSLIAQQTLANELKKIFKGLPDKVAQALANSSITTAKEHNSFPEVRVTDRMICAADIKPAESDLAADQCSGDSGGPLLWKNGNKFIQIGVVSWNEKPCGTPGIPGVYTRLTEPHILHWINLTKSAEEPDP
jgi:secreted trypsin-like serine protease